MRDGEIVQIGTPEDIVLRPADDYVQRFVSDTPRTHVLRAGLLAKEQQTLKSTTPPSGALAFLQRGSVKQAMVVDEGGKLLGTVSMDAVSGAVDRGAADLLRAVTPVPYVRSEDDLDAVARLLATGEHPAVAVVEGDNRLVGTLTAPMVLNALVGVASDLCPS